MENFLKFLITSFLSCTAHSKLYTNTNRRAGELIPTSNHQYHHGSLFFPVDGHNATLDCLNYDRNPAACAKLPHCTYRCHSGHCKDSMVKDPHGCSQYCLDVCGCKQAGCFDVGGVNCQPNSGCPFETPDVNTKGPPMTLRKSSRFPYNLCPDGVTIRRISPKRGDFEYMPVISVNLGGGRHVDENGWIFQADEEVIFEDPAGIREKGEIPADQVSGVSDEDKPLYATYVKAKKGVTRRKRERGSAEEKPKCITYVASLCEEGNYLLDLKVVEPEFEEAGKRLFDVRINDVVVLDELNILAWTKKKGRVAEILVRFFFGADDSQVVIGGQTGNVTDGEIKVSFCYGDCPNATDNGFAVSAFQVLQWQRSVNVYGRSVAHRGDECRCRILAGKEYNYLTTMCTTVRECSPCTIKSVCLRADAVYVSSGMACKNRFARGSCIIEEVIDAVNLNGRAHHDSRGIRYVADDDTMFNDPFKLRYDVDGDVGNYGSCQEDPWTGSVVTGVVSSDSILYETFTRSLSSGSKGMCVSYNVSQTVKKDGKYELVVKTVEPFYDTPGQRSFSIRIFHDEEANDRPILPDFDILRFSDPCEATDVVINFRVTEDGTQVLLPGHKARNLTEARMKLSFCLSTCSGNVTTGGSYQYDSDFIVSAFYIARISDKPEPHIEAAKSKQLVAENSNGNTLDNAVKGGGDPLAAPSSTV